jgi:hypothetical protein
MSGHWPSERARTNDLHLSIPKETAEEALEPIRRYGHDHNTTDRQRLLLRHKPTLLLADCRGTCHHHYSHSRTRRMLPCH